MTTAEARALIAEGRALAADNSDGEFPFPDMRAVDLAVRLMAPGPKACAVSASECREIAEAVIAAYDRDGFPVKARSVVARLLDGYTEALEEVARLKSTQCQACEGRAERLYSDGLMHRCTVCGGTGRKP